MTTHLTLRQLQAFLAVARLGSLTLAAQEQGLTRAALSQSLQELERQLGSTLFDRSGYRLRLNLAGEALLPKADELLLRTIQIERQFADKQLPMHLRLGASDTIGSYLLPQLIAHLLQTFPEVQVEPKIHNSQLLFGQLQRYELDLALVEGSTLEAKLSAIPWRNDALWLIASTNYIGPTDWPTLSMQRWIVRETGSSSRMQFEQLLLPHLSATPQTLIFNTTEAIVQAVIAGLGLALVSSLAVKERVQSGTLRQLPVLPSLSRPMTIFRLKDRYMPPWVEKIAQWLAGSSQTMAQ